MREPKRVQRSRAKGARLEPGAVCVSRGTRWGNGYKVSPHPRGWRVEWPNGETVRIHTDIDKARAHAAQLYEKDLAAIASMDVLGDQLRDDLETLRGKDLACRCPLDSPCHADVLLALANAG
jgi:hypothetical protein